MLKSQPRFYLFKLKILNILTKKKIKTAMKLDSEVKKAKIVIINIDFHMKILKI